MNDPINPDHYKQGGIETIDVIEAWNLPYHLGNTVKYISRAGKKDPSKTVEDLRKAQWYLDRYIKNIEPKRLPMPPSEGKTITFYPNWCGKEHASEMVHSWMELELNIDQPNEIHTTQMAQLSTKWFERGYRIFIFEHPTIVYEIKLGTENTNTEREIRMSHNLYKLWAGGEFEVRRK